MRRASPLNGVRSLKLKLGIVIVLATVAGIVGYAFSRRVLGLSGLMSLPIGLAVAAAAISRSGRVIPRARSCVSRSATARPIGRLISPDNPSTRRENA